MIYIFDMDGTLTEPRKAITRPMLDGLHAITEPKYLVSGSDLSKIMEQIPRAHSIFNRVFACNGTQAYEYGDLIHTVSLADEYPSQILKNIIDALITRLFTSEPPFRTGTFIEYRGSQINFSTIGRDCTQEQREEYIEYDKVTGERETMVEYFNNKFDKYDLHCSIGGQISIDITKKGWDKTYALQHIPHNPIDCTFIGDKTFPGGNDHEIAHAVGVYHTSTGPKATINILDT